MMLPHILLLVCGAVPAPNPTVPAAGDFRFRVKVVEALEGGPCVIEVEFSYEGKKELPNCREGPISVEVPRCWKRRPEPFIKSIAGGKGWPIKKGYKFHSIHFLNQDYAIPTGPARLKISKEIWQTESQKGGQRAFHLERDMKRRIETFLSAQLCNEIS
jgi:hypothetical protein